MSLTAPIYVLKRRAKQLSREAGIPLNQALDRIARDEGFQTWSLLMARGQSTRVAPNPDAGKRQITSLPIAEADRTEFIQTANEVFEVVLERIEAQHPETTRQLWSAEHYVDELLLRDDMLPIDRDYALSLIEAFLVHHVVNLAVEADEQATA